MEGANIHIYLYVHKMPVEGKIKTSSDGGEMTGWRSGLGGQFFITYSSVPCTSWLFNYMKVFIQEIKQKYHLFWRPSSCVLFHELSLITSTKIGVLRIVYIAMAVSLCHAYEAFKYYEFFVVRATFYVAFWHQLLKEKLMHRDRNQISVYLKWEIADCLESSMKGVLRVMEMFCFLIWMVVKLVYTFIKT